MIGESIREMREVESGEHSKSMAIEWQDSVPEILLACEPMELVEILVRNGAERTPLASLTNLENLPRLAIKEKGSRKWRRQDHKRDEKLGEGELRRG